MTPHIAQLTVRFYILFYDIVLYNLVVLHPETD